MAKTGFEEEVSEILKKAETITPERRERLCLGIENQIKYLDQIACEQQHSMFIEKTKTVSESVL